MAHAGQTGRARGKVEVRRPRLSIGRVIRLRDGIGSASSAFIAVTTAGPKCHFVMPKQRDWGMIRGVLAG